MKCHQPQPRRISNKTPSSRGDFPVGKEDSTFLDLLAASYLPTRECAPLNLCALRVVLHVQGLLRVSCCFLCAFRVVLHMRGCCTFRVALHLRGDAGHSIERFFTVLPVLRVYVVSLV